MSRIFENQRWIIGLGVVLALLLVATKLLRPDFGVSGLDALARAALPFALATVGMAIVVIAGGIDLSVAAMMAVASVSAAAMMKGASDGAAVGIILLVLVLGCAMGAINGALIVFTRVPDIVVTLAMLFVWQGVALLILQSPGGGAAPWLRELIVGGLSVPLLPQGMTAWLPKAVVFLAVCAAGVWIPVRRSKLGLMLYAVGSDALAAFRMGIPVSAVRISSYVIAGLFAALGGISLTMSTGIGEPIPGPYLLASVAAVVLGGVVLGGGRGGIIGPILAVFVLRLLRLDLTLFSVDPNVTTIIEGSIMVVVVMLGGRLMLSGGKA